MQSKSTQFKIFLIVLTIISVLLSFVSATPVYRPSVTGRGLEYEYHDRRATSTSVPLASGEPIPSMKDARQQCKKILDDAPDALFTGYQDDAMEYIAEGRSLMTAESDFEAGHITLGVFCTLIDFSDSIYHPRDANAHLGNPASWLKWTPGSFLNH